MAKLRYPGLGSLLVAIALAALWPRPAGASELRVQAASSLADVLPALIEADGETEDVVFSFAASSRVARQVELGAPADVVITADRSWMDHLEDKGLIEPESRRVFARNKLVIAVRSDRPEMSPQQLHGADKIAVAAEPVPAGRRAREALRHHGVLDQLSARFVGARNVRAALALLDRGEVDAAIVYNSDVGTSEDCRVAFTFDASAHQPIEYVAARTKRAENPDLATAFLAELASAPARGELAAFGFDVAAPPSTRVVPAAPVDVGGPLGLTLWVAAMSLLLSVAPATALGWLLARREFPGKTALSTLLLTPLVLPPVVTGFVLLELFGREGVFGPALAAVGIDVAFTRWGAVAAAAVVGFPLLILLTRLAIEAVDHRYADVAQTLGQTRFGAFWRVTLPMALPGLAAGCVIAFARALGEFGATAVLASDIPGQTRTLALAIYALYEQPARASEAHQLVWISVGLCAVALVIYERLNRVQKRRLGGQ